MTLTKMQPSPFRLLADYYVVPRELLDLTDCWKSALFLSELISQSNSSEDGWITKGIGQWQEELRFNLQQVEQAATNLQEQGLIEIIIEIFAGSRILKCRVCEDLLVDRLIEIYGLSPEE